MADLISLRQLRKQKSRADKARQADENRAKFGRTKSEKQRVAAQSSIHERKLDAHKRES